LDRFFLHAASLRFHHPVTGALLEFHSPLPQELQNLLKSVKS
jgi:23S rRNA pseudouridine1911/1915/1917 synthase